MYIKVAVCFSLLISGEMNGLTVPGNGFSHHARLVGRINLQRWLLYDPCCVGPLCMWLCLIQSLVPLWGWKFYKSRSRLLTISINLDFPADSHRSSDKCDAPNQHTLNSTIKLVAGSWGCVAFAVDEWTHSLSFCELWIFFMIFPTQR